MVGKHNLSLAGTNSIFCFLPHTVLHKDTHMHVKQSERVFLTADCCRLLDCVPFWQAGGATSTTLSVRTTWPWTKLSDTRRAHNETNCCPQSGSIHNSNHYPLTFALGQSIPVSNWNISFLLLLSTSTLSRFPLPSCLIGFTHPLPQNVLLSFCYHAERQIGCSEEPHSIIKEGERMEGWEEKDTNVLCPFWVSLNDL